MMLAAAALTTDGSESLATDTDTVSAQRRGQNAVNHAGIRYASGPEAGMYSPKGLLGRDPQSGSRPLPMKKCA